MRIVHISDTHNKLRWLDVPDGDVLVHSGDATRRDSMREWRAFAGRFQRLPHRHKLFVPGNHDPLAQNNAALVRELLSSVTMLIDEGIEIDGVRFYGFPWVPGVGANHNGFTVPDGCVELSNACSGIPQDVDVLITHGAAEGIRDSQYRPGCRVLNRYLGYLEPRDEPRYHLFGHHHTGYGKYFDEGTNIWHYNGCVVNIDYKLTNAPHVIDI